jgi:adenine-specific DNA-methyltransferase
MNSIETKRAIENALQTFSAAPLKEAAIGLFECLGYRSQKRLDLKPNNGVSFLNTFAQSRPFNREQAMVDDWQSVDFLFQLTDAEVQESAQGQLPFESSRKYDGAIIQSYLFFAIRLSKERYTRTQLSAITRSVNRLFDMPAMLLFLHGDMLTLSIIRRRLHKRDESKDVLEKVTLIKDIRFSDPIRAHIEILHDLCLPVLYHEFFFHNFAGLHQAWEKRLDSYALNERFYHEVADWYFWALAHEEVVYPRGVNTEENRSIFLIRLLTRLIFCWFLQEKGLLPRNIFRKRTAEKLLKDFSPSTGTYYQAFLQNLFFATLNQEREKRDWRREKGTGFYDRNRGVTNLYRYRGLVRDPDALLALFKSVPFVNGGLFDCLDVVYEKKEGKGDLRLDDFSEEKGNRLCLPNELFFGEEREVDLSAVYDDRRRGREKVRGLIEILSRYKFTVEENTPLEQEIALDPELLGKVFENLLASYNEDTRTTARKATGSFYTPREIVSYMVDEALIAYLETKLATGRTESPDDARLRTLLSVSPEKLENPFREEEATALITALDQVKILDPACGSGAFPMGVLQRLVDILQKLDPYNRRWKEQQLARAEADRQLANRMQDDENRTNALREIEARIADIERSFDTRFHALDFARKLFLIENCIYGVDIQPIACQIAKLRFFISLIVDQNLDPNDKNLGVRPLPNLETRIVAADTLIPIEKPQHHQFSLLDPVLRPLRGQLERVRHDYFTARTPATKVKCRKSDAELRKQITDLLRDNGMPARTAKELAKWDPYDQNAHATFFDPDWMFGLSSIQRAMIATATKDKGKPKPVTSDNESNGFDIVIGNPPYVRIQTLKQKDPKLVDFFKSRYESAKKGNYDIYVIFVERGLQLLNPTGNLAFILPHKFFNAQYGQPLRGLLAKGNHLAHVVHFGDQQVFPGSTNYVCLLFLHKAGTKSCRYVLGHDLPEWLKTYGGAEADIQSERVTAAEWNFAVGPGAALFELLKAMPMKLGEVADRISQGIRTSANEVYVLDVISEKNDSLVAWSESLKKEVVVETGAVTRFLSGREIKPYSINPSGKVVLIPYRRVNGRAKLITIEEFRSSYPEAFKYLELNKTFLEAREGGRMRGAQWYGFIYPKNIDLMRQPKLLVPDIASFAFDEHGDFAFTSGYAITIKDQDRFSPKFLLGILNSPLLDFYWKRVSTPLRGGFYRYFTQFIEQLPIPIASTEQQSVMENLVEYILHFQRQPSIMQQDEGYPRDHLVVAYFEQIVNGLVYELFFPDELHLHKLMLFKYVQDARLPGLSRIPESKRTARLRELFENLYGTNHPIRGCLQSLRSLEAVRSIEAEQ